MAQQLMHAKGGSVCATCRSYVSVPDMPGAGECRTKSPTRTDDEGYAEWPLVVKDDFCREHDYRLVPVEDER